MRALVAVDGAERRVLAHAERARLVAGLGRLDLDHVGAHVGEHLAAERPGHDLA